VVAPGAGADEILQVIVALHRVAGLLLGGDQAAVLKLLRQTPHNTNSGDDRIEVLAGTIAALLEILEINERRIARVGRAQADLAGAVLRVRL
jgi:hypothetical protein